jgi:hypothetical protein
MWELPNYGTLVTSDSSSESSISLPSSDDSSTCSDRWPLLGPVDDLEREENHQHKLPCQSYLDFDLDVVAQNDDGEEDIEPAQWRRGFTWQQCVLVLVACLVLLATILAVAVVMIHWFNGGTLSFDPHHPRHIHRPSQRLGVYSDDNGFYMKIRSYDERI